MTSWSCQGDKCVLVNNSNSNISNNINNNINNNSLNRFKTNNSVKGKPESISKNMLSNMFWKKNRDTSHKTYGSGQTAKNQTDHHFDNEIEKRLRLKEATLARMKWSKR